VGKGHQRGGHGNGFDVPDVRADPSEWRKTMIHLLYHQIVLLAMNQRRAPLPVSPALWKGLVRLGALNDLYDLGSIARRLSFLGDERILLAELKARAGTKPHVEEPEGKEIKIIEEDHP
jgi:hypothetical protein